MRKELYKKVKFIPILFHEMDFEDVRRLLELHKNASKNLSVKDIRLYQNAILRASVILIVARIEYFIEDLFEWSAKKIFFNLSNDEIIGFYKITSKRFNNPTSDNINKLFLEIGINKIMNKIYLDSSKNILLKKKLDSLVEKRHQIAHGKIGGMLRADRKFAATSKQVNSWYKFAVDFMFNLEKTVSKILLIEKNIPEDKIKEY